MFLAMLFLGACAATTKEVDLRTDLAARPTIIAFERTLDLDSFRLQDREDLGGLVKMGLKLSQSHPAEANRYFLQVADKVPGTELAIAALAAAAMTTLNSGDRDGFLALLPRLEETLARDGRLVPSAEVADLLSLGRYMRGDRAFSSASPRLRQLLSDLERSR
jgi:hypothetical protein